MAVWRMAFKVGSQGHNMWPDCKKLGVAAITYAPIERVDLSQFEPGKPKNKWAKLEPTQKSSLRRVAYEMRPGDVVYVKDGGAIVGRGVVSGTYQFGGDALRDPNGSWWSHQILVEWEESFEPVQILLGSEPMTVLPLEDERLDRLEAALATQQGSRVMFARIGWMKFYDGPQPPLDPKPIAGGKYTRDELGHEVYNFRVINGSCYGHFEPPGRISPDINKKLSLKRILPGFKGQQLAGVTVVFVARRPGGGQVVVGWYRNATVYRQRQPAEAPDLEKYGFYCRAAAQDVVLLPPHERAWEVPSDHTFGQSNVCYTTKTDGTSKNLGWQRDIIESINDFQGSTATENPVVELEQEIIECSRGQGYRLQPQARRAVENRAMEEAIRYFRRERYQVEDTHKNCSYDLICRKGSELLYVEVKGTTGSPHEIILTRNEVAHARANKKQMVLFIVHGIQLNDARDQAFGGRSRILHQWSPDDAALAALQYVYRVPVQAY